MVAESLPIPGDKNAFVDLFKSYYPRLAAYACLFIEPQAAEDIIQDLFVHLLENSGKIVIHTSLDAYLFKAVYQRCLNVLKQRKTRIFHHNVIEDYLIDLEIRLFDPESNESIRKLYNEEMKDDIKNAIGLLPGRCREVFMLSYIYEFKNKEISEILSISQSTVENHVYHALKVLRQRLARYSHLILLIFLL